MQHPVISGLIPRNSSWAAVEVRVDAALSKERQPIKVLRALSGSVGMHRT